MLPDQSAIYRIKIKLLLSTCAVRSPVRKYCTELKLLDLYRTENNEPRKEFV